MVFVIGFTKRRFLLEFYARRTAFRFEGEANIACGV